MIRDTKPADATCSLSEETALGSPPVELNPHLDLGAHPWLRIHPQATAKHLGPLAHGSQTHAPRRRGLLNGLRVESLPVVLYEAGRAGV